MRWLLFITALLTVAVVGIRCGDTPVKHESVADGPVFADLPTSIAALSTSVPDKTEVDFEKMRPGDVVMIHFRAPGAPELEFKSNIRDDGTVVLLSNKVFTADGKTIREFEKDVYNYYGPKIYQITATEPAPFVVIGEVKAPGKRSFSGPITLLQAIESAGGFTERANRRRVKLVRADGRAFMVNCEKARKDGREDIPVYHGDRVLIASRPLW